MNVLKKVNFIVTALDLKSVFMTKDNKVVWLTLVIKVEGMVQMSFVSILVLLDIY